MISSRRLPPPWGHQLRGGDRWEDASPPAMRRSAPRWLPHTDSRLPGRCEEAGQEGWRGSASDIEGERAREAGGGVGRGWRGDALLNVPIGEKRRHGGCWTRRLCCFLSKPRGTGRGPRRILPPRESVPCSRRAPPLSPLPVSYRPALLFLAHVPPSPFLSPLTWRFSPPPPPTPPLRPLLTPAIPSHPPPPPLPAAH